ncbi:MAG: hypothetical protein WBG50_10785 [Desulfomonilaceae bacterium]
MRTSAILVTCIGAMTAAVYGSAIQTSFNLNPSLHSYDSACGNRRTVSLHAGLRTFAEDREMPAPRTETSLPFSTLTAASDNGGDAEANDGNGDIKKDNEKTDKKGEEEGDEGGWDRLWDCPKLG